jgi:hypothetical protein
MNKIKHFLLSAALVALPLGLSVASHAHAASTVDLNDQLDNVGEGAGLGDKPLTETVGQLISVFLGLLGVIFLVLVIYAGFIWMTAAGDEKAVAKARNILLSAVVGLVILLASYAISSFVIEQLSVATQ